tara:strand:- start:278 stop:802 length:525 start_codon:yes stop_codon:yes gene_type:complete
MVDINELKTQQRIFRQEETNIKNKISDIADKINNIKYTPEQYAMIQRNKIISKLMNAKKYYSNKLSTLIKELEARVSVQNYQYDFMVKNEIILKDLSKKIDEQDKTRKEINNDISVNLKNNDDINNQITKLERSNKHFTIANIVLFIFLIIIISLFIFTVSDFKQLPILNKLFS